jgi:hypothetical protein
LGAAFFAVAFFAAGFLVSALSSAADFSVGFLAISEGFVFCKRENLSCDYRSCYRVYLLLFGFSYQQKACKYTSNGLINKYFICFLSMLN